MHLVSVILLVISLIFFIIAIFRPAVGRSYNTEAVGLAFLAGSLLAGAVQVGV